MIITDGFEPKTRKEWRDWLANHHAQAKEIWLVFLKKHAERSRFTYEEALEEALCFGWIDGIRQKIDDLRYVQRFSPRTRSSRWSEVNKALALSLEARGLMTPPGLAWKSSWTRTTLQERPEASGLPDWLAAALQANATAWRNFTALPPSHQRRYIGWISSAKREETRANRITEAIALLMENKRIGLGPGEVRK